MAEQAPLSYGRTTKCAQRVMFTDVFGSGVIGLPFASTGATLVLLTTLTGAHWPKIVHPSSADGLGAEKLAAVFP
jgi:hypothetical protein